MNELEQVLYDACLDALDNLRFPCGEDSKEASITMLLNAMDKAEGEK